MSMKYLDAVWMAVLMNGRKNVSSHELPGAVMTGKHSITEARRNLPSLVREAEQGRVVEITRRGEPVAVLVGRSGFGRLTRVRRGFSESYREFANAVGLAGLGLDPDEVFGDVRDEASPVEGTRPDYCG